MNNERRRTIIPQPGERAFIAGQTGSGKTAFLMWMLLRMEQSPVIIYDTKEEPKFDLLPGVVIVTDQDQLDDAYHNQAVDYIVCRPEIAVTSDPRALDAMLYHHWLYYKNSVAVVDEAYMFHTSGRAGPGMIALYTRGRSSGITTIMATQRPAWISGFAISESQRYYAFYLEKKQDKKNLKEALLELPDPPKFGFYYWESQDKILTKYGAVKLDKGLDTGYVDNKSPPAALPGSGENMAEPVAVASKRRGAIFF